MVLEKVFNDFISFSKINVKIENPDERNISFWYDQNAENPEAIAFIRNYKFPEEFKNYSIDPNYSAIRNFFFANPYCLGKIKNFSIFCKLFSTNPEKFVEIFEDKKEEIFDVKYPINLHPLDNIDISQYSLKVQKFYDEYILAPVLKHIEEYILEKLPLNIEDFSAIISKIVACKVPDEIIEKYFPIFESAIKQFKDINLDKLIKESNEDFFIKYPELIITLFKNNLGYLSEYRCKEIRKFIVKLPKKVIDFIEKEYNKLHFKNKSFFYFFSILIENPNLSYKEHPKVYKRSLLDFVVEKSSVYPDTLINVPEEAVEVFKPEEAYQIIVQAENFQGFFINLPFEKFMEKATAYALVNPNVLGDLREKRKIYEQLKDPQNVKNAKIAFYEYCLHKIKNEGKSIFTLIREIYDKFSKEDIATANLLLQLVIAGKSSTFKNEKTIENKILSIKREPFYNDENKTFAEHKDIIFKVYKEENYGSTFKSC